ncbi:uncharacterized protein [Drosophila bipectinata]|uniref:uncharacterized protein n=1 Tax=Drosophila bipectinata TaxID=42026 RepID=UPI0038B2B9F7
MTQLGLVGPVIAKAKIFLQKLCREKLSWDKSLPHALHCDWNMICSSFVSAQRVEFPRWGLTSKSEVEVLGFCDASIEAYGACVYVVSKGAGVASLKTVIVVKLELSGAELLARLMLEVAKLKVYVGKYFCWCNSAVALSWIQEESSRLNVFVANRVSTLQRLTKEME